MGLFSGQKGKVRTSSPPSLTSFTLPCTVRCSTVLLQRLYSRSTKMNGRHAHRITDVKVGSFGNSQSFINIHAFEARKAVVKRQACQRVVCFPSRPTDIGMQGTRQRNFRLKMVVK